MRSRLYTDLLSIIVALAAFGLAIPIPASASKPRALPPEVVSAAPGIHPLGHGRHHIWGVEVYRATLWIVGLKWSVVKPHAMELEPGRSIPADSLVEAALDEMRDLKLGDAAKLQTWGSEMRQLVPDVRKGDAFVIFCPSGGETLVFLDNRKTGEVRDTSLCPAIMGIWLHPASSKGELRRSLLGH
jgi:hypothetical protein